MPIRSKESPVVIIGDIFFFFLALWFTLLVRYFGIPDLTLLYNHAVPFSLLFAVWILVFFIAGLYDRHTALFTQRLPDLILNTQTLNISIAALFFFLIPYFGITPKTNLILYLGISFGLIFLWRVFFYPILFRGSLRPAILLSPESRERTEIEREIKGNRRYGLSLEFVGEVNEASYAQIARKFAEIDPVIIADWKGSDSGTHARFLRLFPQEDFVDLVTLYEDIFQRVPLTFVSQAETLLPLGTGILMRVFDVLKRIVDVLVASILGVFSLALYPFIMFAIKIDDGGRIFFHQERVGLGGKIVRIVKFRSMGSSERVGSTTRVGTFLRKTRLDELPQLWNVLLGDLSLVGPRPELPHLVEKYEQNIPHYPVRHTVKPGLSGWAQVREFDVPRGGTVDVPRTEVKLSHDLYYVKNRSFLLDIYIMLKTLKTLASRSGS